MATSLPNAYLTALKDYLADLTLPDSLVADGEESNKLGAVNVGRLRNDPSIVRPTIELSQGNLDDVTQTWVHSFDANSPFAQEMGGVGCTEKWTYRYTALVRWNMSLSRELQADAHAKMDELMRWVEKKISQADVSALSLTTSDYDETPQRQRPIASNWTETGGQNSHIFRGTIFIEQWVTRIL